MGGFEVCSDALTPAHLKTLARELMRSLINFRSQIYKINGQWYYKEEFDPEKSDLNDYVTVIPMALDNEDTSADDDDAEIEEKIFQQTVQWLNENRAFNVNWSEYDRAHFDIMYFHFKSQGKCCFTFRFDHSLGDGMLIASLVALFQTQLFDPSRSEVSMDWTNSDDILQLINAIRTDEEKRMSTLSFSNIMRWTALSVYKCFDYPWSWYTFMANNIRATLRPPPKCAFFGEFVSRSKMAIARPIPVSKFKSAAKSEGGTVNDLFMSIALKSLARYAVKMKCPVFGSGAADDIVKLGVASYRPVDAEGFANEVKQFAINGQNANQLDLVPFKVNMQRTDMQGVQKAFRPVLFFGHSQFDFLHSISMGFVLSISIRAPLRCVHVA